ncbi:MAG: DUF362 domain-containing protein [Desulfovibrio sp.]|nr:DUF362 domain-containing protein [Desulfovibrio sp.]
MGTSIAVSMVHGGGNDCVYPDNLSSLIGIVLDHAQFPDLHGQRILVKPNCLLGNALACTNPLVVLGVCSWLKAQGAGIIVADSPGFGSVASVAKSIGLADGLKAMGIPLVSMGRCVWKKSVVLGKEVRIPLGERALACDRVFSLPRVKVHKQMLLSLAVKNCYGCVPGLHKACIHTFYGQSRQFFASYIAAQFSLLPPVHAVVDGIVAMHGTGPSGGKPYPLGLLGACISAPLIDWIVAQILGLDPKTVPLCQAVVEQMPKNCQPYYPLESPASWAVRDFAFPPLLTCSFAPHRLLWSCLRRIAAQLFAR